MILLTRKDLIQLAIVGIWAISTLVFVFFIWYYFEGKRPVDKEIREGEKRMKDK